MSTLLNFFDPVLDIFRYPFMIRAYAVGTLVALCASQIGIPLVIQRLSMIGDGLSHVAFGAIAVSLVLGQQPLVVAVPVVLVAAFILLKLVPLTKRTGDRAIAMLSSGALAVGITTVSLTEGFNFDAESILFGSILGLSDTDVWLTAGMTALVVIPLIILAPLIFSLIFDPVFARVTGQPVKGLTTALAVMTALTVVTGMHIMGALLISSLLVFPASTALKVSSSYQGVLWRAALTSVLSVWIGLTVSYLWSVPAGAAIVLTNAAFYLLAGGVEAFRTKGRLS